MTKEKSKKNGQVKWMRPCDIKVIHTANPKTMEGKYIAEETRKTWTETFIDKDTGTEIPIERHEKLFKKGELLTKDKICEVMFHIQAGDIKDIAVTETNFDAVRFITDNLIPWEVTISHGGASVIKSMYLVRAQSVEKAITVAHDYAGMYLGLSGWTAVRQVKYNDYNIIEDSDECIPEDAPQDPDADYEYFKVTVQGRFFYDDNDYPTKVNTVFIVKAQNVGEAKERVNEYYQKKNQEELKSQRNSYAIMKAVPYETEGIVPLSYCELYYERQNN